MRKTIIKHEIDSQLISPISRRSFNTALTALFGTSIISGCGDAQDKPSASSKPTIDPTKRFASFYVPMRDGVNIAIDLWMPAANKGVGLPTLISATRYGRSFQTAGTKLEDKTRFEQADELNSRGYAFVVVDARGSGASFGSRNAELSTEELLDYKEIIEWLTSQSWSNGRAGAFGSSYEANTAELMASLGVRNLTAVASLAGDFDVYRQLLYPGGVQFEAFTRWITLVQILDGVNAPPPGVEFPTVTPVEGTDGMALLEQARKEHLRNNRLSEDIQKNNFRNDPIYVELAMASYKAKIEASNVPMFVQAGWVDAAVAGGTLERFSALSNSQEIWIDPLDHGGSIVDPLLPLRAQEDERLSPASQSSRMIAFFDRYVKNADPNPKSKIVNISAYGDKKLQTFNTWPPAGVQNKVFHITSERLSETGINSSNQIAIPNKAHTSGAGSRWRANAEGGLDYSAWEQMASSRRSIKLAPLERDLRIVGFPVVSAFVASSEPDGALYAYLEAVLPDNSVIYLTEGLIRLGLRGSKQPAIRTDQRLDRSFEKAELSPMPQGAPELVVFEMFPLAAVLPSGTCLQLSFASSDTDNFKAYSSEQAELQIVYSPTRQSLLTLPVL
jgi:uncharacterized protein